MTAFGLDTSSTTATTPRQSVPYPSSSSLIDMAEASDILIVVAPGGPGTRHAINAEVLEALGPDGVLFNVARGSVFYEKALIEALRSKTILAAGLDVFENEPSVPDELIALDNAVLLPHVGSASVRTRRAMAQCVVDEPVRLGRRQAAAHSSARDAVAGEMGKGRVGRGPFALSGRLHWRRQPNRCTRGRSS